MSDQSGGQHDEVAQRLRRLQQLGIKRGRAGIKPPPAAPEREPATLPSPGLTLLDLVGGRIVETAFGPCHVVETRFPLDEARGGWPLGAALAIDGAAVAACSRNEEMAGFDFRRAAFIDTETSGLSGGAGTFAFMVGIGTFEERETGKEGEEGKEGKEGKERKGTEYVVRQVFMENPGQERALLSAVGAVLARCTGLVSFNGRAFDAPLLENRYLLNREPSPLRGLLHFDLLPAARQRWRLRLPSRSLGSLERDILGFERSEEDVPGWLIPSIYQQYARGGDAVTPAVLDDVARVFYHNLHDIVNMAPLAAILCAPFQAGGLLLDELHPVDLVSIARCFEELAWHEQGESAYRRALSLSLPPDVRVVALNRLAWMLKRQERRAEAADLWQDWITSVPGHDITPFVELAKHHEWHDSDLTAARKWTLWAVHVASQMPPGPDRELAQADLQHRLERLERKLAGDSS
ncbi:MAG: ribonuclease H-like domain-containing protein [Anaerolineae bacterium]|nr:ribonuclease H-like domain-containing protein [Anaerolineae bacterium]